MQEYSKGRFNKNLGYFLLSSLAILTPGFSFSISQPQNWIQQISQWMNSDFSQQRCLAGYITIPLREIHHPRIRNPTEHHAILSVGVKFFQNDKNSILLMLNINITPISKTPPVIPLAPKFFLKFNNRAHVTEDPLRNGEE
jgi:hypothetical protein